MARDGSSQAAPYDRADLADLLRDACRTAESDVAQARAQLLDLAQAAAERGVSPDDQALSIPARTAVRLIERGLPEVAFDVMRYHLDGLPFFTTVDGGRVFAWLPGFQDPRVGAADDVYDISDRITLRGAADEVRWADGKCVIGGVAHLSHLVAEPDDQVVVVLRRPDGRTERFPAVRTRRPDRVTDSGPNLTRLAWSGYSAELDPDVILDGRAAWTAEVEVSREGVVRTGPLPLSSAAGLREAAPFQVPVDPDRHLVIQVGGSRSLTLGPPTPATWKRRFVPRPARRVVGSLRRRVAARRS